GYTAAVSRGRPVMLRGGFSRRIRRQTGRIPIVQVASEEIDETERTTSLPAGSGTGRESCLRQSGRGASRSAAIVERRAGQDEERLHAGRELRRVVDRPPRP